VVEQLAARGALDKLPRAIRDAPELALGLELYYLAFWDLDSCRAIGMGEGPISWLAVDAYAAARGLGSEQRSDLHAFIPAMDRAYLKHCAAERDKGRKHGDKSQPGKLRAAHPQAGGGNRARGR
jgi:hypothetical protein